MTKWTKEYRAEYMQKYIAKKKEELGYKYLRSKAERQKKYYKQNTEICKEKSLKYYYDNRKEILEYQKDFRLLYVNKKARILREIDKY